MNDRERLCHKFFYVLVTIRRREDWLVNGEAKGAVYGKVHVLVFRHHFITALYGQGYDGNVQFLGEKETSTLEHSHLSVPAARAFGEHHYRHSIAEDLAGIVVCLLHFLRAALIYGDVSCSTARGTYERNAEQLIFHHPFEIAVQVAIYEENVKGTLMVAHEDILLVGTQMLPSLYMNTEK